MKILCGLLALLLTQTVLAPCFAAETIVVGYRKDARPFVHLTDPRGPQFDGFLARLCDQVLERAGYEVRRVPVDAASRWTELDNRSIDMLCDTTSVTLNRSMERLFSPMVFLGGVSYAYSPAAEEKFLAADSKAASTAAVSPAEVAPACSDNLSPPPLLRVGVLSATTADLAVRKSETLKLFRLRPGERICVVSVDGNYADGIRQLCHGEFAFFFGDRDMLKAYLDEELEREGSDCDAILSGKFFSYEPYALVVRPDRVDIALRLQNALYQIFSDGTAEKLFEDYFDDREKSALLQALFRINAIGRID